MAKKQDENMFGSFSRAAEQREREQADIQSSVTAPKQAPASRKRGAGATTITLTVSREDKQAVKAYAAMHSTTVSDLFHLWITQYCSGRAESDDLMHAVPGGGAGTAAAE